MDLKFFDHDGRRWMEGEYEGRWFALNEDGDRLVVEGHRSRYGCYIGATSDDAFSGKPMGSLNGMVRAMAWLFESDPTQEPWITDRARDGTLTIPVPSAAETPVC
jgi:hypothetical protein